MAKENAPTVKCAQCDAKVDPKQVEVKAGKVYANCHGARQGVPWDGKASTVTVFAA